MKKRNYISGFTLIELSIVLVVIGLLTGGILTARSLIHSSQIRAQIQQIQQFDIALNNFYQKYNCIPGDCNFTTVGSPTHSGDNDGLLEDEGGTVPPERFWNENYLFFPMLSMELEEKYAHIGGHFVPGESFPKAAIGSGGIGVTSNTNSEIFYILGFTINITDGWVSWQSAMMNQVITHGTMSPESSLAIDTKIDDSIYNSGIVVAIENTGDTVGEIVNSASGGVPYPHKISTSDDTCISSSGGYNLALTDDECTLMIKARFLR